MDCGGCASTIADHLRRIKGVVSCTASYDLAKAMVEYRGAMVQVNDLIKAVNEIELALGDV